MADETIDQEVQRLLFSEKVDYVPPNCEAYQWKPAKRHEYSPQYALVRPPPLKHNRQIFGFELPKEEFFRLCEWMSPKVSSEDELKLAEKNKEPFWLFNGPACFQRYLRLWDRTYGPAYALEEGKDSIKYVLGIWTDLAGDSLSPRESHIKALELLTGRKARWWVEKEPMSNYDFEPGDRY